MWNFRLNKIINTRLIIQNVTNKYKWILERGQKYLCLHGDRRTKQLGTCSGLWRTFSGNFPLADATYGLVFLCFGLKNQKLLEFFKMTCLANHIRDGFRKQQMTSVTPSVIQLTTVVMESTFTSSLLLFTKNIMWIIRRKKNNASCLLSWDLVTGWTRITLEWPPISWRRCSSPCTIQYVDSVTCCDSCAWRPSRTQWRRGRTHSARDKSADRACKKYILPRPMFTAFPDLLSCSYFSFTWNTELLWIL